MKTNVEQTARALLKEGAFNTPSTAFHYLRINAGRNATDIPFAIAVGERALEMAKADGDTAVAEALNHALARLRQEG